MRTRVALPVIRVPGTQVTTSIQRPGTARLHASTCSTIDQYTKPYARPPVHTRDEQQILAGPRAQCEFLAAGQHAPAVRRPAVRLVGQAAGAVHVR